MNSMVQLCRMRINLNKKQVTHELLLEKKLYKYLVDVSHDEPNSVLEKINVQYAEICLSMIVQDCDEVLKR